MSSMSNKPKCDHTESGIGQAYESVNPYTGETETHWTSGGTRSTCEDIDIHRYRCTQCGEIGYYSQAARRFYEKGIKTPGVRGLS